MLGQIVPQNKKDVNSDVKECSAKHCREYVFRNSGLCLEHYVEEGTASWDDEDAERQMVLGTLGYIWGDPMEVSA